MVLWRGGHLEERISNLRADISPSSSSYPEVVEVIAIIDIYYLTHAPCPCPWLPVTKSLKASLVLSHQSEHRTSVSSVTVRTPRPLPCMRKYTKNLRSSCRIANIVQWQGGQSRLTNLDTLHPDRQMYPTFSQLDDPSSHFRRVESEMRVLAAAEEVREQHFDHQDPYLELSNRCCIIAP